MPYNSTYGRTLRTISLVVAGALFIFSVGLRSVSATDRHWTGTLNTTWSTILNWDTGVPGSTDNAVFNSTFSNQPNVTAATTIGGIWVTGSIGQSFTISGGTNTLTLNGNTINGTAGLGILVDNSNAYALTVSDALSLGNAQTWRNNSGNLLTISGALNNNGKTLTLDGTGNTTISGVISGAGSITKSGSGTVILSNASNSYTGTTTINAGDLQTSTFTLSPTTTVSIASGATYTSTGTLNLTPSTTAAQTFISGAGTLRLRDSSSTASAPDIYWNPTGSSTSGASYPVTIASNIDVGTGTRYINGISNRNDYERYGGDLVLSGNLSGSANLTFTGTPNTGSTGGPWQMAYTLAGNNSSFTGGIILTDGANLTLNNASALTSVNTVSFTPSSGAVAGLYLYGRSVTIGALSGTAAGTMNIRNGSLVTDNNTTINPGIVRSNAVLTVQQNTNTTFNGSISDGPNDHGAGDTGTYYTLGLTKSGTGTLTLGGTNSYTGVTTVSGGTLEFAKQVSLYNNTTSSWSATNIVVASGATAAFNVGGTGEFTSTNIDTLKALGTASGGFKSGSFLGLDTTNASGGTFTYGSNIANPNGGANVLGLTKLGTGTLTLTGANSYTGGTTISAGTLALGTDSGGIQNTAANSLGTGAITISSGAQLRFGGSAGAIVSYSFSNSTTLNGGTIVVADGAQHLTGGFAVGASGGTLTTQYAGKDLYLDGVVSGTGALLVDNLAPANYGDGQVHFTAANTYSGTLTISASGSGSHGGRISVDNNNALGNATVVMNGPRDMGFTTTAPVFGALSGSGGITLTSGLNLSVGNNNADSTYSGVFTGSGALTKIGTGTLTLSGANTFTGATTVSSGSLTLADSSGSALGSTTSITVNSSGTLSLGANNQINDSATMSLAGGSFSRGGGYSEGTTAAVGIGALTLTANSHIDFGTSAVGTLTFASLTTNAHTITIDNWSGTYNHVGSASTDRLIFDSDQSANLNNFYFTGYGAGGVEFALGGGFYEVVAATPEPSTWLAPTLIAAFLVTHQLWKRKPRGRSDFIGSQPAERPCRR